MLFEEKFIVEKKNIDRNRDFWEGPGGLIFNAIAANFFQSIRKFVF